MLQFGETPKITAEDFLASCSVFVHKENRDMLNALSPVPAMERKYPSKSLAAKYMSWEISLRDRMARIRAAKWSKGNEYISPAEAEYDFDAERIAALAYGTSNPLEREKILDRARFEKIEELEHGLYFTFDNLCAYWLKLQILNKWTARTGEQALKNLDAAAEQARSAGTAE